MAASVTPTERQERTTDSIEAALRDLYAKARNVPALDYNRLNPAHTALHARIDDLLTELGL